MIQRLVPRALSGVATLAVAFALSGCGVLPMPAWLGGNEKPKPAELKPNPATLAVSQAWSAKVSEVTFPLAIGVSGTSMAIASSDGAIVLLDGTTGREQWRANAGGPIAAGVGNDGTTAAVITRSNELVAVSAGKELWRQKLSAVGYTAPFVAGGRVFILTADRAVSAYDGKTGRKLWTQQRPGEALVLRHSGVMLAVGDTLVVGLSGRLAGLDPLTGAIRWEAPLAIPRGINEVERLVDLVGTVSRVGDDVCARAFQTSVGCANAVRGTVIWTKPSNGTEGVSGDAQFVFGTEADGKVVAYKRESGERAWQTDSYLHRELTAPVALGRSVAFGDAQGIVHFLSREDGALRNRMTTDGSAIAAAPVLVGNNVVVVTRNGGVFAFAPN